MKPNVQANRIKRKILGALNRWLFRVLAVTFATVAGLNPSYGQTGPGEATFRDAGSVNETKHKLEKFLLGVLGPSENTVVWKIPIRYILPGVVKNTALERFIESNYKKIGTATGLNISRYDPAEGLPVTVILAFTTDPSEFFREQPKMIKFFQLGHETSVEEIKENALKEIRSLVSIERYFHHVDETRGYKFVSVLSNFSNLPDDRQGFLVLNAIVKSLGNLGYSNEFPGSVFAEGFPDISEFNAIDLKFFANLYSVKGVSGMKTREVRKKLILKDWQNLTR